MKKQEDHTNGVIIPTKVYNVEEAAELLCVSRDTINELIKEGELKFFRMGKGYKFLGENLLALFK